VAGVVLAACSSSTTAPTTTTTTTTTTTAPATTPTAPDPAWAAIDRDLEAMGPLVGLLAARIAPDGTCDPVHAVAPTTPRPTASQFKLWVLGAVAEQVEAGAIAWDDPLTVTDDVRSLGNGEGSHQLLPTGTEVTVEETAASMISISDNTATDMLLGLLGPDAVAERAGRYTEDPAANEPFLTTRQMLLLHYAEGLGERYLATPQDERAAFLADEVDPLPLDAVGSAYSEEPRFVDEIEWFAAPDDLCRTWAGLHELAARPALAPLDAILSAQVAGIGLAPGTWPTVWYKGGSEPGVLTMGWLAVDAEGEAFVVEAMVSDPGAALAPASITDLVALAEEAFAVLGSR
jgi:hypothetical protein